METDQINEHLSPLSCFIGTFPCDKIPPPPWVPCAYVINTDDASRPGEHWVAIHIGSNGVGFYFDSFGLPPLYQNIIDFLTLHCPQGYYYNPFTIQSTNPESATCGQYCILFIYFECLTSSYEAFLSLFTTNGDVNDVIISTLVQIQ